MILDRDGWRCRECSKPGRLEVSHIVSVKDRPDLELDPETNCRDPLSGLSFERHDSRNPYLLNGWHGAICYNIMTITIVTVILRRKPC